MTRFGNRGTKTPNDIQRTECVENVLEKPCDTCFVPLFYNLEDDDSICRDCEVEE